MGKRKMKFEKLLIKSVDDSLKDTFGETAAEIIYKHLERKHSLKQEEIPKKLEVFIEGLEEFLSSGATVVEGMVLEKLCSNLGIERPSEALSNFLGCVTKLKKTY
ncbi:MAG: hypothetical protein OEX10_01840 [Candidatus Bathyarchaeota archaeon]|nr:hypothetical protein [Candidatus Bathyarchaeota archaeon]MDH5663783.1 hypothetical protein [Candidatus Bathyarchaeota archaeon]